MRDPHAAHEHLDDRVQGAVCVVRRALGLEHLVQPVAGGLLRGSEQARLSDPRLASDQHRLAVSVRDLLPGLGDRPYLLLAADEGRQPRQRGLRVEAARRVALPDHTEELHRARDALQGARPDILQREVAGDEAACLAADHEHVGLGLRLDARRDVRRLAEREHLALAVPHPDVSDHDEAGVDADPHGRPFRRRPHPPDAVEDLEPRVHGPHGVVLVRDGKAEVGQDPVAEVLREVAGVPLHRLEGDRLVLGVEVAQLLGVEDLGERRGAHEVGEEDGQVSPLGAGCPRQLVAAVAAESRASRIPELALRARHAQRGPALRAELRGRSVLRSAAWTANNIRELCLGFRNVAESRRVVHRTNTTTRRWSIRDKVRWRTRRSAPRPRRCRC